MTDYRTWARSTTTASPVLQERSSRDDAPIPKAMMAGQIIDRVPRIRVNVITDLIVWTNWLIRVTMASSLVSSLPSSYSNESARASTRVVPRLNVRTHYISMG
jgi:hypothetical protein